MGSGTTVLTREDELARLIFAASDLSSVHRLGRYLNTHPDLWSTLSDQVKSVIQDIVYETDQVECLVNGAQNFALRY
jgi:hypothetical protein